ncbi:MAG: hypothetical protein H8E46_07930 [FCB group bacterium]|nr:hypothetical protein [FCB group bacterium]
MQGGGAAGGAAAAGAAHQNEIANAVKASGAIIKVVPEEFTKVLYKLNEPLVVYSEFHFFSTSYKYLVSHKGLVFYTKSPQPLELPSGTEVIRAQKVWIPN